ncbi:hypothetical protein ACFX10_029202 [Malus domestica]
MASNPTICVKALVDQGSNKIIFVESGNDLVDTIFSYLTIPMGTVIELARKHSDPVEGFLRGPAIFRVTGILVVRVISPILKISVLQELPFTDIEDHTVHVGKREALLLLAASFIGDSALTNTFISELREPKQEQ